MPTSDEEDRDLPLTSPPEVPEDVAEITVAVASDDRRTRTMKHGDTFAVFDPTGDAAAVRGGADGLFHEDTRYLSRLSLTLDGRRPLLLSSTLRDDNAVLICDLSNPELEPRTGQPRFAQDLVHLRRTRFLWDSGLFEQISVRNFDTEPRRIVMTLAYAADFADIFEVRGATRIRRGEMRPTRIEHDRVTLSYAGLDRRIRETMLSFEPAPERIDAGAASFAIPLGSGERKTVFLEIRCGSGPADGRTGGVTPRPQGSARRSFFANYRRSRIAMRRSLGRAATISSSNEIFNETLRRAVSDIAMLATDTPGGPFPYAGVPWFSTFFGRDALITALEILWFDPDVARGVLRHLAATQATEIDPANDAEPGKILHEMRFGEMAALREVPFGRYYGSVDSTPLFIVLAGAYLERTGDLETIRGLWPNIEAALGWIETHGDRDGDGFVEYGRRNSDGLVNQGWKDSRDSVFHSDGTLARGPIALVEVQAYVYGAWLAAAAMARRLDRPDEESTAMIARAESLRRLFDDAFWDEDLGTYVLALDGEKRPCRVRSSNAGHTLLTRLAYPERAAEVVRTLMLPSSFSGWGIRTIPSTEARYNPMSYHNGSVWPHDNALIATGMVRYGYAEEVARVYRGLFEASTYIDLKRLPELFCGFPRARGQGPTFYPVACAPQAWAAGAVLSLARACLGLNFDPANRYVIFDVPRLPDFVDQLDIGHLTLGEASIDVAFARSNSEVTVRVLSRRGRVRALTRN